MDTLILANAVLFLSTLSLRRATADGLKHCHVVLISIHALLAESDNCRPMILREFLFISIHALLAESDPYKGCCVSL